MIVAALLWQNPAEVSPYETHDDWRPEESMLEGQTKSSVGETWMLKLKLRGGMYVAVGWQVAADITAAAFCSFINEKSTAENLLGLL